MDTAGVERGVCDIWVENDDLSCLWKKKDQCSMNGLSYFTTDRSDPPPAVTPSRLYGGGMCRLW